MSAATNGLRAREVAALTLDDIDWKRERLAAAMRDPDRVQDVGSTHNHALIRMLTRDM